MSKLAIVHIRGSIGAVKAAKNALDTLNLDKQHQCVITEDTPSVRGMLKQIKDYVTWGTISDDLAEEIGEGVHDLQPPKGGFKSVKQPISEGGSLGHREDMDALLEKMR